MHSSVYVYYRVDPIRASAGRRAVKALLEDLRSSTGVSGRVARRRDDPDTWMEIYDQVPDDVAFHQALQAGAMRHGLNQVLAPGSERKIEIFVGEVREPQVESGGKTCA